MGQHRCLGAGILAASILIVGCSQQADPAAAQAPKPASPAAAAPAAGDVAVFFDDFNYPDLAAFQGNGWKARTETGHPGIKGATWSAEGLSFHADIADTHGGAVRMSSVTNGKADKTRQTQFCHARKYREGTYAARIFFRDAPSYGPDGDEVIQTFYAISPLKAPMDKNYSETDFEYLPNGGWGENSKPAMWTTSWDTFQLEPWTKVNEFTRHEGSYAGWRTLVLTVADKQLKYYVDGKLFSEHSSAVYPEDFMSINFNLWFMPKGADGSLGPVDSPEMREYQEDIDWVFFREGAALSTADVEKQVAELRGKQVAHLDNVKEQNPPLPSPCGL
ncbi:glycoside hydrolase family 16 protein [Lysobacter yananisis]|uniref:Glycoside hydrolase family 16 protein n=1 Tax=Lysobacter yananisis TaxID=1003114 RepID=A0ABY9P5V9_9GAMM|nr:MULTISPECIES: glycoside hydrolase family 16 protein [Lysobacter]UZW62595.1 glycoside hydrolase family 16 protein [Lysobacter enzymogenes]WMT01526.1 glycoside hydrolase family 16 protein [Lysobacter yananisis]